MAAFPEVADLADRLLARWPVRAAGAQRIWFEEDGLALTVHIGEADRVLAGLTGPFDAWFLDGFSPARNPAMWSPQLMHRIAALSAPGARLATFTVAGDVRRGLERAGFAVEKRPGFASKRERLEARYVTRATPPKAVGVEAQSRYPYAPCYPKRVAVLGAGIAGAACAHALTRRGVETIVLDAACELGAGASGNPAGLVMPRLDREGALSELFLAAYIDAVATYERLDAFVARGVEHRADPKRAAAFADLLADPLLPEDWLDAAPGGGVMHYRGGLVRPHIAIKKMLARVHLMLEAPVEALDHTGDGWVLRAPDGRARLKADAVILACGAALARFAPAHFLPIETSYGQIEWGKGQAPLHALARGSYVAPFEGGVLFGATFDRTEPPTMKDARARNLDALRALAPDIAASVNQDSLHSRAAIRAATPDRAPIAGLLPDAEAWLSHYTPLTQAGPDAQTPAPAHPGVYVCGGLGARGLTLAPLLGERAAAEMFNQPQVLSRLALNAIHPARFLHRALKRR